MAAQPSTEFSGSFQQPDNTTILVTGIDGQVWIVLPDAGTLWVAYEWAQEPAAAVFIWHQGGSQTTVNPGEGTYTVGATDALVYQLANPSDSIKLGWAYV